MSTVNVDYYTETASVASAHKLYGGWYMAAGQAFTAYPTTLTSVKFYLKKVLLPTGTAHAALYNLSGTFGTTAQPATLLATSSGFNISTISATDYMLEELTFSSKPTLGWGKYGIGLVLQGGNIGGTDYVLMAKNKVPAPANKCHDGNSFIYDTAHGFVYQTAGNDVVFYAYGSDEGRFDPAQMARGCYATSAPQTVKRILAMNRSVIAESKKRIQESMKVRVVNQERERRLNQAAIKRIKR